jgi:hypothetical protein
MTSGYFQCPPSEASKDLTAFTTLMGTYEWNRVPMGQRNARNHFQRQIAKSLTCYTIHVSYTLMTALDTASDTELVHNVRKPFARFRQFKVILNSDKYVLGVDKTVYTGHQIDSNKCIDFPEVYYS